MTLGCGSARPYRGCGIRRDGRKIQYRPGSIRQGTNFPPCSVYSERRGRRQTHKMAVPAVVKLTIVIAWARRAIQPNVDQNYDKILGKADRFNNLAFANHIRTCTNAQQLCYRQL